jgi:pilus assembly protein CpaF
VLKLFTNRPALNGNISSKETLNQESLDEIEKDYYVIRDLVQNRLISQATLDLSLYDKVKVRQIIEKSFNESLEEKNYLFNFNVRERMLNKLIADITGYGPIEPLLNDKSITEIMVNGYDRIYVERYGKIEASKVRFEDEAQLRLVIDRIISPLGRRVDESMPMVDARLPNGYRVNATIPPLSLEGPLLTIRKFASVPFTAQDLIANGSMTSQMITFLRACVESRINIVISGGTGAGKTTLLNVISTFIPSQERIITIEDTAELQLNQRHVIRLERRPPNIEMKGEITIRQLVINSLRMRPDRIVVGECRGGEALDMLQAMNTGHDGSMTTIHSNGPRDALRRIETMVLMAGYDLPLKAIREQIASSIQLVVHMERLRDGTRKVVQVSELQGLEGDTLVMQDIFEFQQTAYKNNMVIGAIKPTGLRPNFLPKIKENSIELPDSVFSN